MTEIPAGWEKCDIGEATHGATPGWQLELDHENQYATFSLGQYDTRILFDDFPRLRITPIRKVQPIEFTVPPLGGVLELRSEWASKTFREVIE